MKIDRLFGILVILLNKDMVTARTLADKFEVSTRTIYRDIDTLSAAGIPIYANKGKGGGIALLDNYTIEKTMINDSDKQELIMALNTLKSTGLPTVDDTISKLSTVLKERIDDWVEVDFSEWGEDPKRMGVFNSVKSAIMTSKATQFMYFNSYGQKKNRRIYPLKLIYKSISWYLYGYCLDKEDFRLFKLARMKDVKLTDEKFSRSDYQSHLVENEKIMDYHNEEKYDTMALKFNPRVAYRLYEYFDEESIVLDEDGNYIVRVHWPIDEWVIGWILSFGADVKVLEPLFLRETIIQRISENIESYKS